MAPPVPSPAPAAWRRLGLPLLIVAAVLAAYWPVAHGAALWDDDGHITKPELRSLAGLGRIWTEPGASQQYYPVLHTAFWLEHRLWGDATLGYHLVNALLHAASALLLVVLLRRLGVAGAAFAGLLFALHPVAVESVAWITEQKNTLSVCLALAAAVVYTGRGAGWRDARYWAATGLYVLAVLAKTMVAPLPAVLLVLAWWRDGRLERKTWVPLVPWVLFGLTLGLFTAWMEHSVIGAQGAEYALTYFQRLMLAGRALWFYAGKVVLPGTLMFFYPRWDVPAAAAGWWPWLLGVLAAGAALAWWARRDRGPLAVALIYAGLLFPALGFFNVYPFRFSYVADHFQYSALAAAAACLGAAGARLTRAWPASRLGLATLVLAAAGVQTWRQSHTYVDNETLWRTTAERNPTSWLAHNDLGQAILDAGRAEESLAHFEAALRLTPGEPKPENNYALALAAAGRVGEAAAHFRRALELDPDYADARANLGSLLAQTGEAPAGVEQLTRAVALKPAEPRYRYNLALALRGAGRAADAERELRETLRLNPRQAEAWNALGYALAAAGRWTDAESCFQTALQLRPDFTSARTYLGIAYLEMHRWTEAVAAFETVLRAEPGNAGIHSNLAIALRQLGRADEAAQHEARSRELRAAPR